jgi:hypothetical protein
MYTAGESRDDLESESCVWLKRKLLCQPQQGRFHHSQRQQVEESFFPRSKKVKLLCRKGDMKFIGRDEKTVVGEKKGKKVLD